MSACTGSWRPAGRLRPHGRRSLTSLGHHHALCFVSSHGPTWHSGYSRHSWDQGCHRHAGRRGKTTPGMDCERLRDGLALPAGRLARERRKAPATGGPHNFIRLSPIRRGWRRTRIRLNTTSKDRLYTVAWPGGYALAATRRGKSPRLPFPRPAPSRAGLPHALAETRTRTTHWRSSSGQ